VDRRDLPYAAGLPPANLLQPIPEHALNKGGWPCCCCPLQSTSLADSKVDMCSHCVQACGFDMDYTLAQYKVSRRVACNGCRASPPGKSLRVPCARQAEEFESMAHRETVHKLVSEARQPGADAAPSCDESCLQHASTPH
jgi:hypothetical protein